MPYYHPKPFLKLPIEEKLEMKDLRISGVNFCNDYLLLIVGMSLLVGSIITDLCTFFLYKNLASLPATYLQSAAIGLAASLGLAAYAIYLDIRQARTLGRKTVYGDGPFDGQLMLALAFAFTPPGAVITLAFLAYSYLFKDRSSCLAFSA